MRQRTWWGVAALVLILAACLLQAAPAAPGKVSVLLVYSPSDPDMAVVGAGIIKRLKDLRSQAGYTPEQLPLKLYYFDKPDEQRKCQKLGIGKQDLPFVGIVRLDSVGDPVGVFNRLPHVQDSGAADTAFARVQALLGAAVTSATTTLKVKPPPSGGREITNSQDGSVLVRIPGGAFTMGYDTEAPQVTLPDFYIGKYAVTNAQFRKFVSATGHKASGDWETYATKWGDTAPVVEVSWNDAVAYCRWAGLRLPTEAEWERAARGTDGRLYPWGNDWDPARCRNGVGMSPDGASAVGSYVSGASPYGCLDMTGNVCQWCSSKYKPYPYNESDGREDSGGIDDRVLRGGSWNTLFIGLFRAPYRNYHLPEFRYFDIGFRVGRTP